MASGRMLNKHICIDKVVHALSNDTCRLAFTWAIAHLDRDGRMPGDPAVVKGLVFPRREDITNSHVEGFIKEWAEKQLVVWYEARGDKWLFFPKFRKNQAKLRYEQEAESRIPPPEEGETVNNAVETLQQPQNGIQENSRELEDSEASPAATPPNPLAFPKPTKDDRDPRVKKLGDYFYAAYQKRRGYPPTRNWGAWGKTFKTLLRQADQETIEAVIDAFFAYDKRTRLSVYDFERAFDNVYGYLYDKVHGRKRVAH